MPLNIWLINKKGEPLLAKPCAICMMALKDAGIKEENINFTTGEQK